ncbi:MAG: hypothetical protein QM758_00250 [Armatimonas sp.]
MRPVLLLAALALLVTGCRNQADAGEELNYLRSDPNDYGSPLDTKDLFPLKQGARLEYGVMRSKGDPYREEATVVSYNGTDAVIESRDKEKKTLLSREGYHIDAKGVWVSSVLLNDAPVQINPPLPFLPLPIEEGKVTAWQGTIGSGKSMVAGRAWTRVTRRQKMKITAGEFMAYRIDLRTELSGNGQNSALLASRWFVPGVGVIRTRSVDGRSTLVKELLTQKKMNSSATGEVK